MDIQNQIKHLEEEIRNKKSLLSKLRRKVSAKEIKDYVFKGINGENVSLSQMFGEFDQLILIQNMGKRCAYCTLWADSLIGLTPYLESRAGFVLISPDKPEVIADFAVERAWNFKVFSSADNSFKEDTGFKDDKYVIPGVLVLRKESDGKMYQVSSSIFGPGDNYCTVFDFFDLLPDNDEVVWDPGKVNRVEISR